MIDKLTRLVACEDSLAIEIQNLLTRVRRQGFVEANNHIASNRIQVLAQLNKLHQLISEIRVDVVSKSGRSRVRLTLPERAELALVVNDALVEPTAGWYARISMFGSTSFEWPIMSTVSIAGWVIFVDDEPIVTHLYEEPIIRVEGDYHEVNPTG